jgi:hypothetical protein
MIEGVLMSDRGVVIPRAWLVRTGWESARGLLGRPPLKPGEALVIPTNSVHTVGMRYPLDLIFLGPEGDILLKASSIPPGRFGPWRRGARWVVEMRADSLKQELLAQARSLRFRPVSPPFAELPGRAGTGRA